MLSDSKWLKNLGATVVPPTGYTACDKLKANSQEFYECVLRAGAGGSYLSTHLVSRVKYTYVNHLNPLESINTLPLTKKMSKRLSDFYRFSCSCVYKSPLFQTL